MNSIRKWFYRPRRDDTSLLAQFYYADEELNLIAGELDNFDGRKDQERCTALVNQLRHAQDKVLNICVEMMEELLPDERAPRDFRVKFPDDVMQETLSGQLWFGAECLAAGSNILNRITESTRMRPLAKAVTKTIENVRNLLREQCLKPIPEYTEKIRESLKIFDRLFADFELSYVSAMVPVKTVEEYEMQQNVAVLFSDTLQRAVKLNLVTQDQIDNYDPALMFTIPRLAIIAGLVIFPDGPLNLERDSKNLSELFRSFKALLFKIRELLWTMSPQELATLEKCLCSMEEPDISLQTIQNEQVPAASYLGPVAYTSDFVHKFYSNYPSCRQLTPEMISLCSSGKKIDKVERKRDRNSGKSRSRAKQERQSERFLSRLTGVEERPRARRRFRRTASHHPHYYQYPEHYDELVPPSHPYSGRETTTQSNSSSRQSHNCRGSTNRSQNRNGDRRHVNSGRHCRTRAPCPTPLPPRHRSSRINTIVCACGSTSTSSANGVEGYRSHVEDECHPDHQSIYPTNDNETHQNFNEYQFYQNYNPDGSEYSTPNHPQNHHPYSHPEYDYNEANHSFVNPDSFVDQTEVVRPANIQNRVGGGVMGPISIYEVDSVPEPNLFPTAQSEVETVSSGVNRLNLQDKTINTEQSNVCDDCNNIQSYCCDTNINCDNQNDNREGNSYSTQQKPNSLDDSNHSSNSSRISRKEERESTHIPFPTTSSVVMPPVPVPRHSISNLKPYNKSKANKENFLSREIDSETTMTGRKRSIESEVRIMPKMSEDIDNDDSSGSTSPHHSGTEDDEEVALALQAAEVAVSWKARERFSDSSDLIQRLFVCISGVADQLQTNYASDLRKILRYVFVMNQTPDENDAEVIEILEGKEHIFSRDRVNEDVTSTAGSEQLSVESAEDALVVIGTPERETLARSPDEVSDIEMDNNIGYSNTNAEETDMSIHTSSVVVPASVFNDHSLMQYSAMSPPPISSLNNFSTLNESHERSSDNDSPSNEVNRSSDVSTSSYTHHLDSTLMDSLVLNIGAISESINVASNDEPSNTIAPNSLNNIATSPQHIDVESPSPPSTQSPVPAVEVPESVSRRYSIVQEPPSWIPDHHAPRCMACGALFTVVRRRHHCRNCGKVFCGHCSRHSVPLPHFGIWKNVRVCNACFLYYVTSTADGSSALS